MKEFTRQTFGLDHVPGVKLKGTMCTKYAAQLVLKPLELAQKLKYAHEDGGQEDSLTTSTVSYKNKRVCTCSFWRTMALQCSHTISSHLHKELSIFEEAMVHREATVHKQR